MSAIRRFLLKKIDDSQYNVDISSVVNFTIAAFGLACLIVGFLQFLFGTPYEVNFWINLITFSILLPVFIFRKKLSSGVKTALIFALALIGIPLSILKTGIYGTSLLVLLAVVATGAIFFSLRVMIVAVIIIQFFLGMPIVLLYQGLLFFPSATVVDFNDPALWFPFVFTFSGAASVIIAIIYFFKNRMIQNIVELEKEKNLEWLAYYDAVTDLPKEVKFVQDLKEKEVRGQLGEGYILQANVKRFRAINILLGSDHADKILRATAQIISRCVKPPNMAARLIGDEFMFWIEGSQLRDVVKFSQHLQKTHSSEEAVQYNTFPVSFHFSAAFYSPKREVSIEECIKNAKLTLNVARRQDDERVCFFKKEILEDLEKEMVLFHQLKKALIHRDFTITYQKQVDIRTEKVVGVEGLVQWENGENNFVSPEVFIPIVTENNLMIPFSKMVFELILADMPRIEEQYGPEVVVSINVSPLFFLARDFFDFVKGRLAHFGVSGERFILEVTEDVFVEDLPRLNKRIQTIKTLGIRISLDDFGTGFSSLSYIGEIDLDELKIDKGFVRGIETDPRKKKVIQSICDIAKALGYRVVVEGVESRKQLEELRQTHCDIVQGFYFSLPENLDGNGCCASG